MAPGAYNDGEAVPPMETNNGTANAYSSNGTPTAPAPTSVDAYKPRGIGRSKLSPLAISHVGIRIFTAVCTLIAFAVIASDSITIDFPDDAGATIASIHFKFHNFFYFSYLLAINVVTFFYLIVTLVLVIFMLITGKANAVLLYGIFAHDQIFSYLLISAATSAATGARIAKSYEGISGGSFLPKAYTAVAFTFIAFFALGIVSLISGFRVARRR